MQTTSLSSNHQGHLLQGLIAIHRRMAELEALIALSARPTPFARYVNDLSPAESEIIQNHFARIRAALLAHLRELGIPLEVRPASLRWALQAGLMRLQVAVDDMGPAGFAGYGPLDPAGRAAVVAVQEDLARSLDLVRRDLQQGLGRGPSGKGH